VDAILFSARAIVGEAIKHLEKHENLYWDTPFRILKDKFSLPIEGLIYIKGKRVEYKATISDIISYDAANYKDSEFLNEVKPEEWLNNLKSRINNPKNTLIITKIEPFSIETRSLKRYDGTPVKRAPQGNYTRIIPPYLEDAEP
jgi:hypothetical protein